MVGERLAATDILSVRKSSQRSETPLLWLRVLSSNLALEGLCTRIRSLNVRDRSCVDKTTPYGDGNLFLCKAHWRSNFVAKIPGGSTRKRSTRYGSSRRWTSERPVEDRPPSANYAVNSNACNCLTPRTASSAQATAARTGTRRSTGVPAFPAAPASGGRSRWPGSAGSC